MREFRARSRSTRAIFFHVALLDALVWSCGSFAEKCGKANKSSRKCTGKKKIYILSGQVGSTVCRVHWDERRRSNNSCSVLFLEKAIHEASGNSEFLPDFLLSWTLQEQQARYKVELQMLYQSGQRNKVYLASCLYTSDRCLYELLNGPVN